MSFSNPDDGINDGHIEELDKSKQRTGKSNGRWKGGRSKSFRRRATNAKKGEVVHHKNRKKSDNRPSNFQKMSPAQHNKAHPEKGRKSNKK